MPACGPSSVRLKDEHPRGGQAMTRRDPPPESSRHGYCQGCKSFDKLLFLVDPAGVYRCEECRPSYVRGQVFHLKAVQGQASAFVTEHIANEPLGLPPDLTNEQLTRSEERRVGKECRSRWSPY